MDPGFPGEGTVPSPGSEIVENTGIVNILDCLIPGDLIRYESEEGDWYGIVVDLFLELNFDHVYEVVWISPRGDQSAGNYFPEDLPVYFDFVQDSH